MKKRLTSKEALKELAEQRQKIIENWKKSGLLDNIDTSNPIKSNIAELMQGKEKQLIDNESFTIPEKPNKNPVLSKSDCREEAGIAIGLIDGIMANLRVLCKHYQDVIKDDKNVQEALKDLKNDPDLTWLLDQINPKQTHQQ